MSLGAKQQRLLNYKGAWDATVNTPAIPAASEENKNQYYIVSIEGTTEIDSISDWKVGDWIVSNGTEWQKIDNSQDMATETQAGSVIIGNQTDFEAELDDKSGVKIMYPLSILSEIGISNLTADHLLLGDDNNQLQESPLGDFFAGEERLVNGEVILYLNGITEHSVVSLTPVFGKGTLTGTLYVEFPEDDQCKVTSRNLSGVVNAADDVSFKYWAIL